MHDLVMSMLFVLMLTIDRFMKLKIYYIAYLISGFFSVVFRQYLFCIQVIRRLILAQFFDHFKAEKSSLYKKDLPPKSTTTTSRLQRGGEL